MHDIVGELTDLNTAFARAELAGNVEFFRHYLADRLKFRRASGAVVDKATFLKDLRAPGNTNERMDAHQIEVLPYSADLAVCSMVIDFAGSRSGARVNGRFRNTRVFIRSEGLWKCALWFNSTEAAAAGGHAGPSMNRT